MSVQDLNDHLATGLTRVCQCWALERADGVTYGFTDHDQPLNFEGITFAADSGMSARALASSTGMSVNNTEAIGLLQSDVISEADIAAGRFDEASVTNWLVQWDNVKARQIRFRGTLGDITRRNGQFEADLRGITDALNQPQGRSFLKTCSAVLGDNTCKFDVSDPAYCAEVSVAQIEGYTKLLLPLGGYNDARFEHGFVTVVDGAATGLRRAIKRDVAGTGLRQVTLWQGFGADLVAGDRIKLVAGCDKRAETCRVKFANLANFQGFPHIPGDDWMMSVPRSDGTAIGGALKS